MYEYLREHFMVYYFLNVICPRCQKNKIKMRITKHRCDYFAQKKKFEFLI